MKDMNWKKISETKDFVSYEKIANKLKVRIEARLEGKQWKVYKIYYDGKNLRLVEEFHAHKSKIKMLIESLKSEKDYTKTKLESMVTQSQREITLNLKRSYKEYEFEKWSFGINSNEQENIIILHFGEIISMDLIINQDYRHLYSQIVTAINKTLGLESIDKQINVYYFNYHFNEMEKYKKKGYLVGKIEVDVDDE